MRYFAIHIFLPLFIGLLIYIFFRSDNIVVVNWVFKHDYFGMLSRIKTTSNLPYSLKFCLPNALWYFSFQSYMLLVWNDERKYKAIIFVAIFVFVIAIEFMQKNGIIRGTFDIEDILYIVIATLVLLIFHKNSLILKEIKDEI
jgi:hypothetical protein